MSRSQPFLAVDILSDDEDDVPSISYPHPPAKRKLLENSSGGGGGGGGGESAQQFVIIDDDPTPKKPNMVRTPLFVAETPLPFDSHETIVKCSIKQTDLRGKLTGISSLICLESDNDSEGSFGRGSLKESGHLVETLGQAGCQSSSLRLGSAQLDLGSLNIDNGLYSRIKDATAWNNGNDLEIASTTTKVGSSDGYTGNILLYNDCLAEDLLAQGRHDDNGGSNLKLSQSPVTEKLKRIALDGNNNTRKIGTAARKKQLKEEKARLVEERKQKRQEEKLQKEALKAEAAELKKLDKEKQKWEKGKLALKSIIAEIDAKVLENGSIGGHLLTRFAERGLSYRITSNPFERSILWKLTVPEQIAQLSNMSSEVPYILLLYQAEEFCDLVISESLIAHVQTVRSQYPLFTICYLTNKLMNFINKCEQSHYKNSSNFNSWKCPPVEEALSMLSTHFAKVHSRQCIDEAEIADHIVGLTSSLASCQFRTKLTWLSVNANGSNVSKDFIDKKLIKKNVWLKVLVAIPKVQPRHAVAVWKKYPTMRSLLNVYMDPNKSVHEKEFLLKDLMVEGLLGKEDRRLGEVCSKRIFRILMAQRGSIRTDDVEDGADLFEC